MVLSEWASSQKPHLARAECIVDGCGHEEVKNSLCQTHTGRCITDLAAHGLPWNSEQSTIWASRQLPYLGSHQFSLANLRETVRLELLYTLQQRDAQEKMLECDSVRFAEMQYGGWSSLALYDGDFTAHANKTVKGGARRPMRDAFLQAVRVEVLRGLWEFQGIDPRDRLQWDLRMTGIRSRSSESGRVVRQSTVDFAVIRQPWLRSAAMEWARTTKPDGTQLRDRVRACELASRTLDYRPGGSAEPTQLGFADMTAVFEGFVQLRKEDGELYSHPRRRELFSSFIEVVGFGRLAGQLDTLPAAFSRHPKHHSIKNLIKDEDDIGKALPESVIDQLDQNLGSIGTQKPYGAMAPEDVHLMFRTAYIVLRDTGRRPYEIAGMRFECLERDGDEWQLIWDNHKARRLGRRLPIFEETVEAILIWRKRMTELGYPSGTGARLFPPNRGKTCMPTPYLAMALRAWIEKIPELRSNIPDSEGGLLPFNRNRIFPYAFRHTYCQRHADAGVPPHLLMELMDHNSLDVTRGYYKVSLKRRREAAETMRKFILDRAGQPRAGGTALGYERKSVAVPYGNCEEPANVKAGGQACPIRFQCAGCPSYSPDPSYLPAIQDELIRLKGGREIAAVSGVAGYIVDGMDGQIRDYTNVVTTMRTVLAALPETERQEVEEAARLLRKSRAGSAAIAAVAGTESSGRRLLPLTVVRRDPTGADQ